MKHLSYLCFLFSVFCAGCVAYTDETTGEVKRTVDAERVAEVAQTAANTVDEYVPGTVGTALSGLLGLVAAGAGYYAKRKKGVADKAQAEILLKQAALKAVVAGVEVVKENINKNIADESGNFICSEINKTLKDFQNASGAEVREEIRSVRNEITEGAESQTEKKA